MPHWSFRTLSSESNASKIIRLDCRSIARLSTRDLYFLSSLVRDSDHIRRSGILNGRRLASDKFDLSRNRIGRSRRNIKNEIITCLLVGSTAKLSETSNLVKGTSDGLTGNINAGLKVTNGLSENIAPSGLRLNRES